MKTDEELMWAYAQGSEEAFEKLYEKYSSLVYGLIKKRMRDSEVEDLYQKVWRHLHEKRSLYKGQPFAPWLFVLIRHLLIDEYRSLARKDLRPIQNDLIEAIYRYSPGDEKDMDEILKELPVETREIVKKYYLDGNTYEDLENETGLSQSNLRQRLSRAIRSLRKIYEE